MKDHFGCPIQATSNVMAGKWKVLILWQLSFEPMRFAALRDALEGVSEKVLTAQLRQLERDGLLLRESFGTAPARVEYSLSAAGQELVPVMYQMCNWGIKNLGVVPNYPRIPAPQPTAHVSSDAERQ
jgi:DNA-binding HxlR family transcriptional regulator